MTSKLYLGDCLEIMRGFEPDCIDLTVTSPPYDNLRTYKGYTFDFEGIARELYRITKPGGVVVWVVGDATINGSETGTSFRQALYFKDVCGFNLHDTMIYDKNGFRYPFPNRYHQVFEYMFILHKPGPGLVFNPINDRKAFWADTHPGGHYKREADGSITRRNGRHADAGRMGRRYNIWRYAGAKAQSDDNLIDHPAVFPEALARDHILSWSNPGDTVFDPMMGSGTTGKMAVKYERNFIGCEIAEEYFAIAERRIHDAEQQPLLPFQAP